MSKTKLTAARAASLKVKTQSIASKLPATRNGDGSVKERDKTGGKSAAKPAATATKHAIAVNKPGNGKHAETIAQVAAAAVPDAKADNSPTESEPLAPSESVELPMKFLTAALSIAPKDDSRYYLNGVFVHQLDDKTLRLVSTDGHRLFLCSFAHDKVIDWAHTGAILPRDELERITKYVGKNAGGVRVEFGVRHPAVKIHEIGGMAVFTFSAIDGKFPEYQRVVDSAAAVFTAEREELTQTTIDSAYLKAAGALSAQLESKGVIPFLAPQGANYPSVFAFADVPEALLYVMSQQNDRPALAAPTIKLFGDAAMREQLAKLEEQIKRTRENAKTAKHEKFRTQFEQKADRLQLRADQIRANLSVKLPAPAQPAVAAPTEPAASVSVH